ncbi:MAG: Ig-like domain-containing protein, partial [Planctomycetota bacterium]
MPDLIVISTSPGNGDQLDFTDSNDGFNPLNNPTLQNPGSVTIRFSAPLDPASVINTDPTDPQGSRNVRLFYFDTTQGPFDPDQPSMPGVNPPGANVLVKAQTILSFSEQPNDTLIIRPTGFGATNPMPDGQYSVIVERGVTAADRTNLNGAEYFFYFRVGEDTLPPSVVSTSPANGERGVDPFSEIRINLTETIRAGTVDINTIMVNYQPTGVTTPIAIPGTWYSDGGNGPGNNFPALQLDRDGVPGFTGQSPRNGADLVFRPNLTAFPVNMNAIDPVGCGAPIADPPEKGNRGFPLGQAITVTFNTMGLGVTDTAGNAIQAGSPNISFTFEVAKPNPSVFAPSTDGALYFGDPIGVGVIDIDPSRTPYRAGPNPVRAANSVVTIGAGRAAQIVRVPVPDLVDMKTDTRPYTAFHTHLCATTLPNIFNPVLYAASQSSRGGEIVVIDSYLMRPMGRFGTPSPGGVSVTAVSNSPNGRLAVSNFSANTVTMYDIRQVAWYDLGVSNNAPVGSQTALMNSGAGLILNEADFAAAFPSQRFDAENQFQVPGPPIIGTVSVGVSPSSVELTQFPNAHGTFPLFTQNTILGVLNAGESTADFSELTNLGGTAAIQPDLDGVSISSQPKEISWTPVSSLPFPGGGATYYGFITAVGGTVELFATGFSANAPTVRGPTNNLAPNKIVNNVSGLQQPNGVQWITNGSAVSTNFGFSAAALVAETGLNRLQQLGVTQEFPSNRFEVINSNLSAGLGPSSIAGDPRALGFFASSPRFTNYFVANTGEGTVRTASYVGG